MIIVVLLVISYPAY
ncbi:hypothetical protein [Escherichia coli]|nr:hypothetical protein [Escherichia coli]